VNLKVLQKSRKRQADGDVFAARPPDERYIFGRVISTNAHVTAVLPAILIYIYKARSTSKKTPDPEAFRVDQLLIPPIMTNRRPWLEGYFETIGNRPLPPDEVLPRHCFKRNGGVYFDEQGNRLSSPNEPCGEWGLHSYRTIDDAISDALGIPQSPD
jgi:Immunity protein 26